MKRARKKKHQRNQDERKEAIATAVAPKLEEEESEHSKKGPSSLRAIELCSAFEQLQRDTTAADEGELAHKYFEKHLLKHDHAKLMTFSDDMQGHIHKVWDYMNEGFLGGEQNEDYILYEKKVDLREAKIPDCDKGTVDIVYFPNGDQKYCKAADYKMGFIEVDDAEQNIQAWMYAVGLWLAFPALDRIDFEIIQPKANCISRATFYRSDLENFITRAFMIVRKSEQGRSIRRTPNTGYCRFCSKLGTCKEARTEWENFPEKLKFECPSPNAWQNRLENNDAAALVFNYCKSLEKQCKKMCDDIANAQKDGMLEVSGHRLATRKGTTSINDLVGLRDFVLAEYDISEEEYLLAQKPVLAKLTSLVRALAERGKKKDEEALFLQKLHDEAYVRTAAPSSWLEQIKD